MSKLNELLQSLEAERQALFAAQLEHIGLVSAEQRSVGSHFDSVMCEVMLNDITAEVLSITVQAGLVALFSQLMRGGWNFNEGHLTLALWATIHAVNVEKAAGLVKVLVLAGAKIDAQRTANEDTLLMMAVRAQKGALVHALLCAGASTGIKNKSRHNAFNLIEGHENLPMLRYFNSFKVAKSDFLGVLRIAASMLEGSLQQVMTEGVAPACVASFRNLLTEYRELDDACKRGRVSLDAAKQELEALDKRAESIAETHGVELGEYPDTDSTEENDEAEEVEEAKGGGGPPISDQRVLVTGAAAGVTNLCRIKSGL
jgi:hypothetical protein